MMQYGGPNLGGIGVLDETYIVTDRTLNNEKIYECPLTSVGISTSNCEVFAEMPQGTAWDPINVLVDPIKRLVYKKYTPAHYSLTASVVIPYAGDWTLEVTQDTYNVQHFLGSPHLITVAAAATDPAECVVTYPKVVTAGSIFTATVSASDSYSNPTDDPADDFKAMLDSSDTPSAMSERTFSEVMTTAGSKALTILLDETEISNSPATFQVLPDVPDASTSTHNVGFTTFNSAADATIELRAAPFDRYNNTVSDATGFAVTINDEPPTPLPPPAYASSYEIPAGSTETLTLSFTYNGEEIANSPVTVEVAPESPFSTETMYIVIVSLIGGVGVVFAFFTTFQKRSSNTSLMTVQKEIKDGIVGIASNAADPATDYLNWYVVVSKCSGAISAIYIAFVGISVVGATASVAVSLYQMKNLTKDTAAIKFENGELEEELTALKASKKSAAGAMSGALAAVLPVFGASEEAAPKTPLEEKEDKLLEKLEEIRRKQTEIFQKKRKKLRVIAGAAQALIEDLPITIFNILYMVHGCGMGFGGGERKAVEEPAAEAAFHETEVEECNDVSNNELTVFIFSTVITVAFATYKLAELSKLKQLTRMMELMEETNERETAEALELLEEVEDLRGGGQGGSRMDKLRRELEDAAAGLEKERREREAALGGVAKEREKREGLLVEMTRERDEAVVAGRRLDEKGREEKRRREAAEREKEEVVIELEREREAREKVERENLGLRNRKQPEEQKVAPSGEPVFEDPDDEIRYLLGIGPDEPIGKAEEEGLSEEEKERRRRETDEEVNRVLREMGVDIG
ncbi:hypothetical protein TeGR_g14635 [Tetraparma gracilis]|uniref:Uncharacterized protein n=1 Tax=Tetraparma gracilis TaxID=2962635 RepID=A0ABQ6MQT9_9STRA|nr:hypothetical protein TeGR_g14635 [Tetraparma gracilis]